jgi:hypothetical protein
MIQGMRQSIREDLDVVYYFRGDIDDQSEIEPGWYLETAGQRRIGGPWDSFGAAFQVSQSMPSTAFINPENDYGRR